MTGSDLCGLDDGEVVNPAESSSHWCSEPRCAKAHAAAESVPQIIEMTRRHQSLHLSPSPAVLQPGTGSFHESPGKLIYTHTLNTNTHPPLKVVQMHPFLPFAWKTTAAAVRKYLRGVCKISVIRRNQWAESSEHRRTRLKPESRRFWI